MSNQPNAEMVPINLPTDIDGVVIGITRTFIIVAQNYNALAKINRELSGRLNEQANVISRLQNEIDGLKQKPEPSVVIPFPEKTPKK